MRKSSKKSKLLSHLKTIGPTIPLLNRFTKKSMNTNMKMTMEKSRRQRRAKELKAEV